LRQQTAQAPAQARPANPAIKALRRTQVTSPPAAAILPPTQMVLSRAEHSLTDQALAAIQGVNPAFVGAPPTASTDSLLAGAERIRHDTLGNLVCPNTGEVLEDGFKVIATSDAYAWHRFADNSIADTIVYVPGQPFKERHELEPAEPKDGSMDCWTLSSYMYCIDTYSGTPYVYYGGGFHVRKAIHNVGNQTSRKQAVFPGALPLIAINKKQHQPKNRAYRPFFIPIFDCLGWVLPSGELLSPEEAR
jgi:hypothetical protein